MTPTDFAYWLAGVTSDRSQPAAALGAVVLKKAAEVLDVMTPLAVPPKFKPLAVPRFCLHNVSLEEECRACPIPSERVFGFSLPPDVRQVYIPLISGAAHGGLRHTDGHGAPRTNDKTAPDSEGSDASRAQGGLGLVGSALTGRSSGARKKQLDSQIEKEGG
jgi:hypothetical protein